MEPFNNDPAPSVVQETAPRKPYHPPEVTLYGDLAELTRQDLNPPLGKPFERFDPLGPSVGP